MNEVYIMSASELENANEFRLYKLTRAKATSQRGQENFVRSPDA